MSRDLVAELQRAFERNVDDNRARQMAAYMRDQFDFLGIAATRRREIQRYVLAGRDKPAQAELAEIAERCWQLREREYQYFACDYVARYVRSCDPEFLGTLEHLITAKSWWDTVDTLAVNAVGPLIAAYPESARLMDLWIETDDLWIARSAILFQNKYREATDARRLFDYCRRRARDPDFFLRKAIGWALREYAKTDPAAVRRFVDSNADLSPLSRREALENIA